MAYTRENEKFLLQLVDKLLDRPNSEWAIEDISLILSKHIPPSDIGVFALVQNVERYCIENVSAKQAEEFYRNFSIPELRTQLIEDFKKMEHERRRDDFQNFSLHMLQQIEGITNYFFKQDWILDAIQNFKSSPAFMSWSPSSMSYRRENGQSILSALLWKERAEVKLEATGRPVLEYIKDSPKKQWTFLEKLRATIYFGVYSADVTKGEFESLYHRVEAIYQARNLNHRGGNLSPDQTLKVDNILKSAPYKYLEFYGTLGEFAVGIAHNLERLKTGINELPGAVSIKSQHISSNGLEALENVRAKLDGKK